MLFLWYDLRNNHSLYIFLSIFIFEAESILQLLSIFCKIFRLHRYLWMQIKSALSLYQI